MKKTFEEPTIEILNFQTEDVLISSNVGQMEYLKVPSIDEATK